MSLDGQRFRSRGPCYENERKMHNDSDMKPMQSNQSPSQQSAVVRWERARSLPGSSVAGATVPDARPARCSPLRAP